MLKFIYIALIQTFLQSELFQYAIYCWKSEEEVFQGVNKLSHADFGLVWSSLHCKRNQFNKINEYWQTFQNILIYSEYRICLLYIIFLMFFLSFILHWHKHLQTQENSTNNLNFLRAWGFSTGATVCPRQKLSRPEDLQFRGQSQQ